MFSGRSSIIGDTPPVVKNLILLNIVMLVVAWVLDANFDLWATKHFALFYFKSPFFMPLQYVTHMFMHGGVSHLFFNMFALWMFGRILEKVWGSKRFFLYYIITGLGAAVFYTFVNYLHYSQVETAINGFLNAPSPDLYTSIIHKYFSFLDPDKDVTLITEWFKNPLDPNFIDTAKSNLQEYYYAYMVNVPMVGASGAVFGILLAFGMLFPNTELMLLFPPIPIKAKWFVLGYGAIELYLGLYQPGSNIAHFAHLGGMLFGFILIKYWKGQRTNFY